MPTIQQNVEEWGLRHDWSQRGEEWSGPWSGSQNLWWMSLYPRLRQFLPAARILEIAPGHGRITDFLRQYCDHLTVVDLNASCVEACQKRFAGIPSISYYVNDGRSLEMISDASVDVAFSFDSLVHADADVIGSYLEQLSTKLSPEGVGFFHHSNAGSFLLPIQHWARWRHAGPLARRLSRRLNRNWRSADMTKERFRRLCDDVGLQCISQESLNWSSKLPNDCFSIFTRTGSKWHLPYRTTHTRLSQEMNRARSLSLIYRPPRR